MENQVNWNISRLNKTDILVISFNSRIKLGEEREICKWKKKILQKTQKENNEQSQTNVKIKNWKKEKLWFKQILKQRLESNFVWQNLIVVTRIAPNWPSRMKGFGIDTHYRIGTTANTPAHPSSKYRDNKMKNKSKIIEPPFICYFILLLTSIRLKNYLMYLIQLMREKEKKKETIQNIRK